LDIFGLIVGISSRLKGRRTVLLSVMSQKKKKKLLVKIKNFYPLWLHMKTRRIPNPTTQTAMMKTGKNSKKPIKSSI
jgi:hypothetical protein